METLFEKYFPLTCEVLGTRKKNLQDEYLKQMGFSSKQHQESVGDLRYFAGFVRQKNLAMPEVIETAQWEGAKYLLSTVDMDFGVIADQGTVILNPGLQTVEVKFAEDILQRAPGLYALVRNQEIIEVRLEAYEALLLDLVQEDRKFTPQQLLQMMDLEESSFAWPWPTPEEREKRFEKLVQQGILKLI